MSDALAPAFAKLRRAAEGMAHVVEGTCYGTPALKVDKKLLARVKDAETVVLVCAPEDKALLIEAAPEIYFETDHYRGWPLVLARIGVISEEELRHRRGIGWRMVRKVPGRSIEWEALVPRKGSAADDGPRW
ncbi:MAG: MmcQ/YjbR family DNA-binding protein [Mesorhizobium sp.]|nr:MmcQ/YjbR family DNA-binding protein [Mesorhizobium sp.]